MNALALVDPEIAREKARNGDLDGAIECPDPRSPTCMTRAR